MSDAAQKKDEFKKHVRALLLSCPAALTVRELERDFYNFIGVRLAYRDIGYATIEDFLRYLSATSLNILGWHEMLNTLIDNFPTSRRQAILISRIASKIAGCVSRCIKHICKMV
jgi:hypothetical protein